MQFVKLKNVYKIWHSLIESSTQYLRLFIYDLSLPPMNFLFSGPTLDSWHACSKLLYCRLILTFSTISQNLLMSRSPSRMFSSLFDDLWLWLTNLECCGKCSKLKPEQKKCVCEHASHPMLSTASYM